jgi:PDZ domain-containing secreted protein
LAVIFCCKQTATCWHGFIITKGVIIKPFFMSVNLSEKVQQYISCPPLQKIDPNTQTSEQQHYSFEQLAIPAVLTALYKYVQSDTGTEEVLRGDESTNWVGKIFHGNQNDAVEKIKTISGKDVEDVKTKMNAIANAAILITKENLTEDAGIKEVKTFFLNQRNDILLYLVPHLRLGELINDDTIDDNVNKMEGPISGLMKSIGSAFSNPVISDDIKKF